MWMDPDDDPRDTGTELVDERTTLVDYLRTYRLTLEMKCGDLDAEQLACRSVPPSTMSLLGLIRHMAEVERYWFRRVMAGSDVPRLYCSDDEPDGDWDAAVADPTVVPRHGRHGGKRSTPPKASSLRHVISAPWDGARTAYAFSCERCWFT